LTFGKTAGDYREDNLITPERFISKKVPEVFSAQFAMRSGGGDSVARKIGLRKIGCCCPPLPRKEKVSVVIAAKGISDYSRPYSLPMIKAPNKSPEPTPRLVVLRSFFWRAKLRGNLRGVAHL
jgi:hypothetical protein